MVGSCGCPVPKNTFSYVDLFTLNMNHTTKLDHSDVSIVSHFETVDHNRDYLNIFFD